ncbi:acyltransferase [Sulfurimonas sp. MAG313]|nr:acyltransferase [Sulfurimonas sp. MAG313]
MLFHYTFNGIYNGKISSIEHIEPLINFTKYGYLGVELFFMISGFVIFHSSANRTASQFIVSRAIRLYPAYWIAVIFTSMFAINWGGTMMSVDLSQILINLTMLQNYIHVGHVDGVYWTLIYEVKFYALIFLFLILGLQKYLSAFFILWPFLMLIAFVSGYNYLPYLSGTYYFFSAGALFAIIQLNKSFLNILSILISFSLCLLYSMDIAISRTESMGIMFSEHVVGAIIIAYFIFFILLNFKKLQLLSLPLSQTFGALTYPVYLIHAHFGYMFLSKFASEDNKLFIYILTISIVIFVGYFIHRIIEIALYSFWKKIFMSTLYIISFKMENLLNRALFRYRKFIFLG